MLFFPKGIQNKATGIIRRNSFWKIIGKSYDAMEWIIAKTAWKILLPDLVILGLGTKGLRYVPDCQISSKLAPTKPFLGFSVIKNSYKIS